MSDRRTDKRYWEKAGLVEDTGLCEAFMQREKGCLQACQQPFLIQATVPFQCVWKKRSNLMLLYIFQFLLSDFFSSIFLPFLSFFAMRFYPSIIGAPLGRQTLICILRANVHSDPARHLSCLLCD